MKKQLFDDDPHWKVFEHLNAHSGELKNTYYYKSKKCLAIKLEGVLAEQLAGYCLVEKDLRNVQSWLASLEKLLDESYGDTRHVKSFRKRPQDAQAADLMKALTVAIATFYGKLFVSAKGRRVSLDRQIFKEDSQRASHDELMSFRHQFAAHSGKSSAERVSAVLLVHAEKNGLVESRIVKELKQPNNLLHRDVKKYSELIEFLRRYTVEKISLLRGKVHESAVKGKHQELFEKSMKISNGGLRRS